MPPYGLAEERDRGIYGVVVMRGFAVKYSEWLLIGAAVSLLMASPATTAITGEMRRLVPSKIAVTANGARSTMISGDETTAECARFRLTSRDVRAYFATAGRAASSAYNHDLDMSRCHATGTVRFTNGWQGRWAIDRARRGSLTLTSGRQLFFYCPDCTANRYYPLDGEDLEHGRALINAALGEP